LEKLWALLTEKPFSCIRLSDVPSQPVDLANEALLDLGLLGIAWDGTTVAVKILGVSTRL